MNKKKRTIIFVICLFLLVTVGIVYIFSELYAEHDIPITTVTDAYKFKNEYESVNNNDLGNGKKVRELTIADNNPFVYKTAEELVKMIEEDKTFTVYFGFSTCPWCRSVMTSLIDSSLEKGVKKVYYVDIKEIRDTYELNDSNEPVRTKEGTDAYYRLLELLNPVLTDYNPLKYETKTSSITFCEVGLTILPYLIRYPSISSMLSIFFCTKILSNISKHLSPLNLTIPIPPIAGAVDIAAIVDIFSLLIIKLADINICPFFYFNVITILLCGSSPLLKVFTLSLFCSFV